MTFGPPAALHSRPEGLGVREGALFEVRSSGQEPDELNHQPPVGVHLDDALGLKPSAREHQRRPLV